MRKADHLQGSLEVLVLKVPRRGPKNGYAIATQIEQAFDEVLRVEEGSLDDGRRISEGVMASVGLGPARVFTRFWTSMLISRTISVATVYRSPLGSMHVLGVLEELRWVAVARNSVSKS
ncbi:MAG: hypothetical protein M3Y72_08105 [Acidobacteriota bacterium]|nr:hypothetical protein [Acidobacteriota bacterium]